MKKLKLGSCKLNGQTKNNKKKKTGRKANKIWSDEEIIKRNTRIS